MANPIIRTHFTFTELVAHWQCTENDLRDAIASQRLVPSIHLKGVFWELAFDTSGKRTRKTPAVFVNELMYLVEVKRLGAFDCAFTFYSREADALQSGSLFKADSNGYVDIRKRMSDVEQMGCFVIEEVARSEALYRTLAQTVSTTQDSSAADKWWATDHNVIGIANGIKGEWQRQGRSVIQAGARHGNYGRLPIGEAVAKKIVDAEKVTGQGRSIQGRTIADYLRKYDWN